MSCSDNVKSDSSNLSDDLLGDRIEEIDSYREEFGKLKETFQWCIRVETWKTALKIDPRTEHLVLSQLHPALNAFYDAEKSRLENTRKDVFLRIKEWSFRGPVLFWLYGVEGTGKTTMCHTVARSLDEEGHLAACFFWDKNDRDRRQAERLLPTLSYQLAKWRVDYRAAVLDVLESHDENPFSELAQGKFSESRLPREQHLVILPDGWMSRTILYLRGELRVRQQQKDHQNLKIALHSSDRLTLASTIRFTICEKG
ncbi:hypothetical protein ACEPAF_2174 [Sanghuangporus sanghuang]